MSLNRLLISCMISTLMLGLGLARRVLDEGEAEVVAPVDDVEVAADVLVELHHGDLNMQRYYIGDQWYWPILRSSSFS